MLHRYNNKWTIENIKNTVKVLKDNEIYRIGDCVKMDKNKQIVKEIVKNPKYNYTILKLYHSTNKTNNHLYTICKNYKETHNIICDENTLYVHVRLGDDFMGRCIGSKRNFDFYLENINKSKINKVTIVTAIHYGTSRFNNMFYTAEKYNYNDKNYLNNIHKLHELITKINKPIDIISNENVDTDFVTLIFNDHLLTSKHSGSFSKLVQTLHNQYINSKLK